MSRICKTNRELSCAFRLNCLESDKKSIGISLLQAALWLDWAV